MADNWGGDGRLPGDGPKYGNWCGKHWSGGWNPNNHCGKSGPGKAIDDVDKCCMAHDNCYDAADKLCPEEKKDKIKECDKALVGCLEGLGDDPNNWHLSPGTDSAEASWYRKSAISKFKYF